MFYPASQMEALVQQALDEHWNRKEVELMGQKYPYYVVTKGFVEARLQDFEDLPTCFGITLVPEGTAASALNDENTLILVDYAIPEAYREFVALHQVFEQRILPQWEHAPDYPCRCSAECEWGRSGRLAGALDYARMRYTYFRELALFGLHKHFDKRNILDYDKTASYLLTMMLEHRTP